MKHTVQSFDEELGTLAEMQNDYCNAILQHFKRSIAALSNFDQDLASRIIAENKNALMKQQAIESYAMHILARRQPVANDLRWIISVIRTSGYLLQIIQDINSVCNRTLRMKKPVDSESLEKAQGLFSAISVMLTELNRLLSSPDSTLALSLHQQDNEVDVLYYQLYKSLLRKMRKSGKKQISQNMNLLFAARNTERIADNIVVISALVYQQTTGDSFPSEDKPISE